MQRQFGPSAGGPCCGRQAPLWGSDDNPRAAAGCWPMLPAFRIGRTVRRLEHRRITILVPFSFLLRSGLSPLSLSFLFPLLPIDMALRTSATRLSRSIARSSTRCLATVHTPPVTQNSAGSKGPTAMVFLNMGGPSTTDEVHDFLSRLFVGPPVYPPHCRHI